MIISLLLSLFLMMPDDPYVVVLTNNKRMKVQAPPECSGRICTVTLLNGEKTSIPSKLIDQAKTQTYNKDLADKKEEARLAAEKAEKARLEAQVAEDEVKAKKQIVLRGNDELPQFDRSTNALSGIPEPPDPNAGVIGEPKYRNFKSTDAVFIQSETVTRYSDRHEIVCVLKTNVPDGVQNVKVKIKANFEDGPPIEQTKSAGSLTKAAEVSVTFVVQNSSELLQTRYNINYETVE